MVNVLFDERFRTTSPPYFPTTNAYESSRVRIEGNIRMVANIGLSTLTCRKEGLLVRYSEGYTLA